MKKYYISDLSACTYWDGGKFRGLLDAKTYNTEVEAEQDIENIIKNSKNVLLHLEIKYVYVNNPKTYMTFRNRTNKWRAGIRFYNHTVDRNKFETWYKIIYLHDLREIKYKTQGGEGTPFNKLSDIEGWNQL